MSLKTLYWPMKYIDCNILSYHSTPHAYFDTIQLTDRKVKELAELISKREFTNLELITSVNSIFTEIAGIMTLNSTLLHNLQNGFSITVKATYPHVICLCHIIEHLLHIISKGSKIKEANLICKLNNAVLFYSEHFH